MDAQRGAVLDSATGILRGMTHREVIAARKPITTLFPRTAIVLTAKMLVSAFFQARQTRAQGRKTWIDAHFWQLPQLAQCWQL
jgi:hypothetical protein